MIGRRNFLKVLGIGTASAPIAAKMAAEAEVAKLTSLRGRDLMFAGPSTGEAVVAMPGANGSKTTHRSMMAYMKMFGVPAHVEKAARHQSMFVSHIDPDIACKRSWSFNVKVQSQRQRNYEREIGRMKDQNLWQEANDAFSKVTGFHWNYW